MPSDYSEAIGHLGLEKAALYTIKRFGLQETKESIMSEWKKDTIDIYANEVGLKDGAADLLKILHANNIPVCAATANDEDCYLNALINNNIYCYFDFILNVSKMNTSKDKPDIYLAALNKINQSHHLILNPNDCMIFEDLSLALNTAKNAGFKTCAVFEKTCKDELKKKNIADIYIKSYHELTIGND
jgi:HAD superfamily hydrolase (TIGR01509 family)